MSTVWRHFVLVWIIWICHWKVLICVLFWLILRCLFLVSWRALCVLRFLWVKFTIIRTFVAWLACRFRVDFRSGEILKIGHVLESLESSACENLLQGHANSGKLIAQFFTQGFVICKVKLGKGILEIGDQWMILDELAVVFNHLCAIKLTFLTVLLILVRVFWILVERVVSITVYSDLERFHIIIVGSTSNNSIFNHL